MLIDQLSGLFHKAIMQSGSIFNPWARGYQSSRRLAEILNLPNSDETEVMETLTNLPVMKVLELQDQLGDVRISNSICATSNTSFLGFL